MPMRTVTRSSAAPVSSAIQEPNENPAAQSGRSGIARVHVVERRREVLLLARAAGEGSVARADAAEVEAQHGAARAHEPLGPLVDRLGVHRPAVRRQRMREDDGRLRRPVGRVDQRLEPAGRALSDHELLALTNSPTIRANRSGCVDEPDVPGPIHHRVSRAANERRRTRASTPTGTTRSSSGSPVIDQRRRARRARSRPRSSTPGFSFIRARHLRRHDRRRRDPRRRVRAQNRSRDGQPSIAAAISGHIRPGAVARNAGVDSHGLREVARLRRRSASTPGDGVETTTSARRRAPGRAAAYFAATSPPNDTPQIAAASHAALDRARSSTCVDAARRTSSRRRASS